MTIEEKTTYTAISLRDARVAVPWDDLSEETKEQILSFARHTAEQDGDAHIHGWRTPSGYTITPHECPQCVRAQQITMQAASERQEAARALRDLGREIEDQDHNEREQG